MRISFKEQAEGSYARSRIFGTIWRVCPLRFGNSANATVLPVAISAESMGEDTVGYCHCGVARVSDKAERLILLGHSGCIGGEYA